MDWYIYLHDVVDFYGFHVGRVEDWITIPYYSPKINKYLPHKKNIPYKLKP